MKDVIIQTPTVTIIQNIKLSHSHHEWKLSENIQNESRLGFINNQIYMVPTGKTPLLT